MDAPSATTDRPPVHDILPAEQPPAPTAEFRRLIDLGHARGIIDQAAADRLTAWCAQEEQARRDSTDEMLVACGARPLGHRSAA